MMPGEVTAPLRQSPEASGEASGAAHEDSASLPLPSPETVLRRAEIEQSRRTAIAGLVFSTLAVLVLPFVGGNKTALVICEVSLVVAELNNLWLLYIASNERRYHERHLLIYFGVATFTNAGVIYHIGVFGPMLVMFVLNLYSACLGYGRRVALVTLAGSIAPLVVLGSLMTAGILADPGLATVAPFIGSLGRGLVVGVFLAFMIGVYLQARSVRELLVGSLRARDEAVRRASHREALFLEARQDLERALQAGGLGRFTDQTLGSYRLGSVLGRGGMGEVYEAVNKQTGQAAAVKMLLPEALGRPEQVRRFMRELRIAASLDSDHVVRVLEIGDESAPLPYLAMERLHGEDLAQILRRETRLTPSAVVEMVRQIGRGLEAAGSAGIVHRDLKPHNVFRAEIVGDTDKRRVWKILDFGIAKVEQHSGTLTVNDLLGTPQYMAPEQASHEEVGASADLHALGAIAYRALTGHPPFKGRDLAEILAAVLADMPVRPSTLVRVPADVDLALAIALAKRPADRFSSPSAFAEALDAAISAQLSDTLRNRARGLLEVLPWREPR